MRMNLSGRVTAMALFGIILSGSGAAIDRADAQAPISSNGRLEFYFVGDIPLHLTFLADYVRRSAGYAESQVRRQWRVLDLQVAYKDLNDDGVAEMVLSYAEVSSYYCGTGGCDLIVFQWRDGRWQEIGEGFMFAPWVSDEKVGGYRTLFTSKGPGLRWDGERYRDFCTENAPPEIRTDEPARCERG